MTPAEVKAYFGTTYQFNKRTGMSCTTLLNWTRWGVVPLSSQIKLEKLTDGALKAQWHKEDMKDLK